jgi:acetyl esterase/lipase
MSRIAHLLALPLTLCPLLPAQTTATPPAPSLPPGIVFEHDIVYGKGGAFDLHADLAYPKNASAPTPAIIHIHGGGWIGGSYHDKLLVPRAQEGYFAASIEYRLSNVAKWPAQIEDCKCAVRWLRANAAKYNVDPNRIGVIGESAGGHLVACLGTMAGEKAYEGDGGYPGVSSAVQAVVDFYGPTDFITPEIYTDEAKNLTLGLFGVPREQDPALWKSGSPVFYVKAGDPPMLLVHGDADRLVPLAQSQVFADALAKAGVPYQFLVIKNGMHGLAPAPGTTIDPGWPVITKTVRDFFAKHLAQPAPASASFVGAPRRRFAAVSTGLFPRQISRADF